MFSGIVKEIGSVRSVGEGFRSVEIAAEMFARPAAELPQIGASVAVSGVCLTVVGLEHGAGRFDLASETLRCTTLGFLQSGMNVNLEPSLRFGDTLDGHLVQGHVDAVSQVLSRATQDNTVRMEFTLAPAVRPLVVPKGSICIDGVSLTVGEVTEGSFSVYLIPHTLTQTIAAGYQPGSRVNLETDCIARYVKQLAAPYLEENKS